ncbi:helix-turn-helix domain-containing protein [Nocardioides sp. NPDC023903]|uniref:TetR/AcrR family transcriptional regulator n=1 Tax=Nocardioides sp. NPDC023903 TaxID=3157195 RepID=UPI0033D52F67
MTGPAVPIRMQTRAVVRSLLARTALELFAAQGYDETTVDEVAAAAGVSRRTLFNYFRSKEDLALSGLAEQGEQIAARFAERPDDEDIWVSLRAAFQVLDEIETAPEHRLAVVKLLFSNDSLRAGHAEKQARWTDILAPLIENRLPASPQRAFAARAIAATGIVCLQTAMQELARLDGQGDAYALYDAAIAAVTGQPLA